MSLLRLAELEVNQRVGSQPVRSAVVTTDGDKVPKRHRLTVQMRESAAGGIGTVHHLVFNVGDPHEMALELQRIPGVAKATFRPEPQTPPGDIEGNPPPPADGGSRSGAVKDAIATLVNHIPTEVVTGYVAVLAIVSAAPRWVQWSIFAFFLIITPLCYWLAVATGLKARHRRVPWKLSTWPRWNMAITTFAFLAWAAVLPNSPMGAFGWYQTYMGLAASVMVALLLGLIDRFAGLSSGRAR